MRGYEKLALVAALLVAIWFGVQQTGLIDELRSAAEDESEQVDSPAATRDEPAEPVDPEPVTVVEPEPEAEPEPEPAPEPEPEPEQVRVRSPYDPGGLPTIAAQLTRELGYAPRMYSILLSDTYVQFEVQDPKKPRNVDSYTWRDGEFTGPEPARVNPSTTVAEMVFPLAAVNLRAIAPLTRRAVAIGIEDAELSTTIIQRGIPFTPGVRILMNVSGSRESRQLRADARGRVTDIV